MAATGTTVTSGDAPRTPAQPGFSGRRTPKNAGLPYGWPIYALFGAFPLWWFLGMGELIWPIMAVPMLFKLMTLSKIRVPKGAGWYALFMLWMLFSATQLTGPDRIIGFAYRALLYISTAICLMFVYNAPKKLLSNRALVMTMLVFWLATVAGGLAGLIIPEMQFKTVAESLLPARLLTNDFIYTMVHPSVAQVQTFLGYPVPRPKAPFVYTNDWGGTYALLVPFLIAGYGLVRTFWKRTFIKILAVLSLLPVVFSLNRTLWLCLVITGVYGSFRLAARGKKSGLQGIVAVCLLFFFILNFGPTKSLIDDRVKTPHSNQGRATLYQEAIEGVKESPALGFGAPRPSVRNPNLPSVGTQGQFWLVLYSHGLPGAFLFTGFMAYALARGRRAKGDIGLWCHVCVLVAVVQMPFYGLLAAQLHVVMVAIALVERDRVEPDPELEPVEPPVERGARVAPVREAGVTHSPQPVAADVEGTAPTAGLEWACRLLFGHGNEDRARVAVPGTQTAPGRRPAAPSGYHHVESYLAVPRASDPRLLVPLGSARAAATVLGRSHEASSRKSRAMKALLAAGLRVGVAQRVLSDRVDVAVADGLAPAELPDVLLSRQLAQIFGRPTVLVAVLLGPPRLNRKPVLQVLTPAGEVVGYVKGAWNDLTRRLVSNEARVLAALAAAPPRSFSAAAVVHHGPWGELDLLATSALPNTGGATGAAALDPPLAVIEEIAAFEGHTEAQLAESPYWAGILARMTERAEMLDGQADPLAPIVEHVERRFGAVNLGFGSWHGDFTPWNMARLGDGTYVWDWERCSLAPLGLDLLHFLFQSVCRFEGRKPSETVEICRERTPELLATLHVQSSSEDALWSLYRLELLFRYDEARLAGVLARPSRIHNGILEMFIREMEAV